MKNKKPITLIELVIVIAIIALVGSWIGINTLSGIKKHRFHANIHLIESSIHFAKEMALTNQADVYFCLQQQNKGIVVFFSSDEKTSILSSVLKKRYVMKDLVMFINDDKLEKADIFFSSSGAVISEPFIVFSTKDGKMEKKIFLTKNN